MLEKENLKRRGGNKGNITEQWKQEHAWSFTGDKKLGLYKATEIVAQKIHDIWKKGYKRAKKTSLLSDQLRNTYLHQLITLSVLQISCTIHLKEKFSKKTEYILKKYAANMSDP